MAKRFFRRTCFVKVFLLLFYVVNIVKFLRTPILKNFSERLFLNISLSVRQIIVGMNLMQISK